MGSDDELDDQTVIGVSPDNVGTLSKDRAYLIVIAGTQVGEMIPLKVATVIGRGVEADVRLLEDKMSRKHCRLVADRGVTYLEDLGSSNGTFVNGVRVTEYVLEHGTTLRIGSTELRFLAH